VWSASEKGDRNHGRRRERKESGTDE
jgi:hypothetical protein